MFQVFHFTAYWTLRIVGFTMDLPCHLQCTFRWSHKTLNSKRYQKSLLTKTQQLLNWKTYFDKWQNLKHFREKVIKKSHFRATEKSEMQEMDYKLILLYDLIDIRVLHEKKCAHKLFMFEIAKNSNCSSSFTAHRPLDESECQSS